MDSSNTIIQVSPITSSPAIIRDSIRQLLLEHIAPAMDATLSAIQTYLTRCSSTHCSSVDCGDNDLERFNAIQALFQRSKPAIKQHFLDALLATPEQTAPGHASELSLMDNQVLDKKIMHQVAAEALMIHEATRLLLGLKSRLAQAPEAFYLLTPENICTSFADALTTALDSAPALDCEQEEQILLILADQLQEPALALWLAAEQQLAERLSGASPQPAVADSVDNRVPFEHHDHPLTRQSQPLVVEMSEALPEKIPEKTAEKASAHKNNAPEVDPEVLATLSLLQQQLEQSSAIEELTDTIKTALTTRGISQRLCRHHHDLIALVGLLFEFIVDDHNLNSQVRQLIGRLQIPILKLALQDQDFLHIRHHPARLLLNEMTRLGMKCPEDAATDDPAIMLIEDSVRQIVAEETIRPECFAQTLNRFQQAVQQIPEGTAVPSAMLAQQDPDPLAAVQEACFEEITLISHRSPDSLFQSSHGSDSNPPFKAIPGLVTGSWIEFIGTSKRRLRCQLEHINEHHDRYTFINRSGMKVAEKSGATLRQEIKKGTARIIDHNALLDKALHTVMGRFMKS